MNKVELLAPAGDMECFKAAIKAGADAVYLAGKEFGARASAVNFTTEELIEALNYAHLRGRKVFLTLNTLIKEREWHKIYDFLLPLYNNGLDGIIIQDYGLIKYLSEAFPDLELHASTQMTVTSIYSAKQLRNKGIKRIVPARELSLEEIKEIKEKTELDIETFVHGALCYGYSGQCLFSSFLGGRSGNRGRCAGPCRLPYKILDSFGQPVKDKEILYPLSLKDLCTIDNISELIEAGIDSFKIEGRMKSPQYVAGVTGLYRKYIDRYYAHEDTRVSDNDKELLTHLYLRSGICNGYYYKHNGSDMITHKDPSYNTHTSETDVKVAQMFLSEDASIKVDINAYFAVGERMSLSVRAGNHEATVTGPIVEPATNRAASESDVEKQIKKLGGTGFILGELNTTIVGECFLSVSVLNDLRRSAIARLSDSLLDKYKRNDANRIESDSSECATKEEVCIDETLRFDIYIKSINQLKALKGYKVYRLCVPFDLIYIDEQVVDELISLKHSMNVDELYITLPRIIRSRDKKYIANLQEFLTNQDFVDGVVISNLDGLGVLNNIDVKLSIICDSALYGWNKKSHEFLKEIGECVAPLELSYHEIGDVDDTDVIIPLYGYTSLMVSANCLAKTSGRCTKRINDFDYTLLDRYRKKQLIYCNCIHCYNELYNNVPTSYHKRFEDFKRKGYKHFKLDFSVENDIDIKKILDYYLQNDAGIDFPLKEYTSGHLEKGAV